MKNTLVFSEKEKDGIRYLLLDTTKTIFRNIKWKELGDWGKRKCENMVVLSNMNEARKQIEIAYV